MSIDKLISTNKLMSFHKLTNENALRNLVTKYFTQLDYKQLNDNTSTNIIL